MGEPVDLGAIEARHKQDAAERIVCFHPSHPDQAAYNDRAALIAVIRAHRAAFRQIMNSTVSANSYEICVEALASITDARPAEGE